MSINLIEDKDNPTPDYYSTWQTQLFRADNGGPEKQRENMTENNIFGCGAAQGWVKFYKDARKDLIFVMDDSWDVPLEGYEKYYGSLELDKSKFPSFYVKNDPQKSLEKLVKEVKSFGWKGLGGWVCAQESAVCPARTTEEYWKERLKRCQNAGFCYWKVDWGNRAKELAFREMLTELKRQLAPDVVIEHAMLPDSIAFAEVFRTYDVPAIMSIPMTMRKTADCLTKTDGGMINCEDEVYIAAALGCVMGVMRHPLSGNLPCGQPDLSFPALHRNLKTKISEVTRAARWHRMAPAFGVKKIETNIGRNILTDYWDIKEQNTEIEKWWGYKDSDRMEKTAPCAISRNMTIPRVKPDNNGYIPYIVSSKNPNGIISVAALGRTVGREYLMPECEVEIEGGKAKMFGIFGEYEKLIINTEIENPRVFIQDIAGDTAFDITEKVDYRNKKIIICGKLIHDVGTMCNAKNDTSEPGAVLAMKKD